MQQDQTVTPELVFKSVQSLLATCIGVDIVDPHAPLRDLGVDSFTLMELLLRSEQTFSCKLPLELLREEHTRSLKSLSDFICAQVSATLSPLEQ